MQLRFPNRPMAEGEWEFISHHTTLLDGELVVDEDRDSGKPRYRYLAYDIMALNDESVVHHPWKVFPSP